MNGYTKERNIPNIKHGILILNGEIKQNIYVEYYGVKLDSFHFYILLFLWIGSIGFMFFHKMVKIHYKNH